MWVKRLNAVVLRKMQLPYEINLGNGILRGGIRSRQDHID